MDYTTNLSLAKPVYDEAASTWTAGLNANADTIDSYLAMLPIVHFGGVQIGLTIGKSINTIQTPVVY